MVKSPLNFVKYRKKQYYCWKKNINRYTININYILFNCVGIYMIKRYFYHIPNELLFFKFLKDIKYF